MTGGAKVGRRRIRWRRTFVRAKRLTGRVLRNAPRFLVLLGVGFVGLSVLLVGAYRFVSPPVTMVMIERRLAGERIDRRWTSLDEISPYLVRAVIAAEDTRFCLHRGIDVDAVRQALDEAEAGKKLRGASTISQQTAKNAFLWTGGGFVRKAVEAWFTLVGEAGWGQRRTLEL